MKFDDITALTLLLKPGAFFDPSYAENRDKPELWKTPGTQAPTDEELLKAQEKWISFCEQQKINTNARGLLLAGDWILIRQLEIGTLSDEEFAQFKDERQAIRQTIDDKTLDQLGEELRTELSIK
jgi:hypothetical protein